MLIGEKRLSEARESSSQSPSQDPFEPSPKKPRLALNTTTSGTDQGNDSPGYLVGFEDTEESAKVQLEKSQAYIWDLEDRIQSLEEQLEQSKTSQINKPTFDDISADSDFLNLTSIIKDRYIQNLAKALNDAINKKTMRTEATCSQCCASESLPAAPINVRSHNDTTKQILPLDRRSSPVSALEVKKEVLSAREALSHFDINIRRSKSYLKDIHNDMVSLCKTHEDGLTLLKAEQEAHRRTKVKLQALRETLRSAMEQD